MISSIALVASLILFGKEPFGHGLPLTLFSIFISMLLIIRHKSNIKRILNGTESKIGKKATSPDIAEN
jgi:glycerol-3-phosphate acyltransferase PlsY